MICYVGSLFGAKSGSKMGSESHLRRGSPQKASWRPLGALLEASGAEKSKFGGLLEPSWSASDRFLMSRHRSTGGRAEVRGASFAGHGPWGAPLIKDYRLKTTTLYAGSEHAMGRRPGEFQEAPAQKRHARVPEIDSLIPNSAKCSARGPPVGEGER